MTSFKQFEANRRNARKSTGPTSEEGKQRSRCNAVRHGLTAETVIGALEDAEDYKTFEAAIIADYDAQSAVERELYCDWPAFCGACAARQLLKPACSKAKQANRVGSTSPAKFPQVLKRLFVPCSDELTQAVSTLIQRRTAAHTDPSKRLCIRPANSRFAFCDSPICPTTRSTASADMKQPFGAKPGRSFLPLMPWIVANRGIEGAASV
jgi:hypothetical protein